MIVILIAGTVLWLSYGVATAKMPIIISNGVTFALVVILLLCKIRYRSGRAGSVAPAGRS